ncbi:hypothetical protein A2866_04125 [Candidatus Roizmanbacteria bacterium RIFCSPHIGHO2_01_FULL_39_8]|uniref:Aspartyl/glutamyl-tRNA(Asn/Gln) amidotransferase subunit C n=3 Tax=Candidatus Roizmaniibacteriota TaxID=1752723 RepID=A0A1F7GFF1_9BACT|nr:MAG: hypothetical protein A2866_04125 [Candidatus Roizmanbacteria bacterium RIFCSPHIGHO2_01_FULL_39_8]OGK28222.1 MAG: hypothetical protein A3C28_05130 [Candidatus Roizmanbacteria bacterium RIFCSPHIGHO2_02_FULL_39_9]OGK35762.1 MAG: hypothetical protein A3F60_01610 [Candidatus Roizmanbacteria bacterium RIFCSPHIGHO2_12_FULL_39_8]
MKKKHSKLILTSEIITHVARLAHLKLTPELILSFQDQLSSVISYMSKIQSVNTDGVPLTSQVTKLTNVWREDKIDEDRMFTQAQALQNAKKSKNGYFVVKAIFSE